MLHRFEVDALRGGEPKVLRQWQAITGDIYARAGKRALDLTLCLLALPIVLTILLVAWVIGQFAGGQVFFVQPRVGRGGRVFGCFKLRTMVIDADAELVRLCRENPAIAAEWQTYQKLENDPRIGRWGAFLRKSSIDELPQIFNVLLGDMSLVGPRPFMAEQEAIYRAGGGIHYYLMRPGITGPWQVEGRGDTHFLSRIKHDKAYFGNLTLLNDLRLIFRTASTVLRMTGG